ncbi:cyclic pyranopterin monophosphate synthase MoaC [Streptomyces sp. NPDC005529]|uniref:cyclic pyranopterin monophosphate synthase MoaC n=1 Tax=unclassified Streptomyces TaxID=2593676 RepID=UPI0033B3F30D
MSMDAAPRRLPHHGLTHLDEHGAAHMVDVSAKNITVREARASGAVVMSPATLDLIIRGAAAKGDVLAAARLAGIMAAKRTGDLIPLCHPLGVEAVSVDLHSDAPDRLRITARAKTSARTGIEMEALTAVAVAGLTVIDMCKAVDRAMEITDIRLEEKSGGRSGHWHRPQAQPAAAQWEGRG